MKMNSILNYYIFFIKVSLQVELFYHNVIQFYPNEKMITNIRKIIQDNKKTERQQLSINKKAILDLYYMKNDLEIHFNTLTNKVIKSTEVGATWISLVSSSVVSIPIFRLNNFKDVMEAKENILNKLQTTNDIKSNIAKYIIKKEVKRLRFDQKDFYLKRYKSSKFNYYFNALKTNTCITNSLDKRFGHLFQHDSKIYKELKEILKILDDIQNNIKNDNQGVIIDYNYLFNSIKHQTLNNNEVFNLIIFHEIEYGDLTLLKNLYITIIELFSVQINNYEKLRSKSNLKVDLELEKSKYYLNQNFLGFNKKLELSKANTLFVKLDQNLSLNQHNTGSKSPKVDFENLNNQEFDRNNDISKPILGRVIKSALSKNTNDQSIQSISSIPFNGLIKETPLNFQTYQTTSSPIFTSFACNGISHADLCSNANSRKLPSQSSIYDGGLLHSRSVSNSQNSLNYIDQINTSNSLEPNLIKNVFKLNSRNKTDFDQELAEIRFQSPFDKEFVDLKQSNQLIYNEGISSPKQVQTNPFKINTNVDFRKTFSEKDRDLNTPQHNDNYSSHAEPTMITFSPTILDYHPSPFN